MKRPTADRVLNCRGVPCPTNYVKTKLALEEMAVGEILEVIVDEGEPSRHVPESVLEDGQNVLDTFKDESGFVHVLIEKKTD